MKSNIYRKASDLPPVLFTLYEISFSAEKIILKQKRLPWNLGAVFVYIYSSNNFEKSSNFLSGPEDRLLFPTQLLWELYL